MILLHPLIDDSKNTCGKVVSVFLTTFPQALLLLWWRVPTIGHLYFAENRTFLLCVDTKTTLFLKKIFMGFFWLICPSSSHE